MISDDLVLAALDPDGEDRSLPALLGHRVSGQYPVDEWGFDPELAMMLSGLAAARWSVSLHGIEHVPEVGPVLLLHNRRPLPGDQLALATAVGRATGRPVRFTGVPDRLPALSVLRRLGGVPGHPADLRSLFRAGEVVAASFDLVLRRPFGGGAPGTTVVEAAMEAGVAIAPVLISGPALGRRREIRIGAPVSTRRRRSALSVAELAESIRRRVDHLAT